MKLLKYLFLLLFLLFQGWTVQAQEQVFAGAIDGKHTVHLFLTITGKKAEVLYFYDRYGMPIPLEGTVTGEKIQAENSTEKFAGTFDGKLFAGTWTDKRRKHELPFALKLADTGIKTLNGRYKCEASRSGPGGGASVPMTMDIKSGTVTRFSIESVIMPHAHSCNPDHAKLRQSTKGNVLFLEGTADPDQPCPISVRRAGPFLWLRNEGGGCLCGARASIPDLLLDTRNSTCRIAQ